MQYFIKDNYYFDIDHLNQLRITGPENHLLMGLTFPRDLYVTIKDYFIENDQLSILVSVPVKSIMLALPLVTDIRSLRNLTEPVSPKPTYEQLIIHGNKDILPRTIKKEASEGLTIIKFINEYTDFQDKKIIYGSSIEVSADFTVELKDNYFSIRGNEHINFKIKTISNIIIEKKITTTIFKENRTIDAARFNATLRDLYAQTTPHIEHLILTNKTSSFEYGTIFPRDWIESADLGKGDLTQETVDYMYEQSMINISESGEGWHEDLVGEFRIKIKNITEHVDRKMIDIEPHYILGIKNVSKEFLLKEENHQKLKRVAKFICRQAKEQQYITFKPTDIADDYFLVGNWRDSIKAFPSQQSPLAPYDVNCVFYPMSLRFIRQYHDYFDITDLDELTELITHWDNQKNKFRLYHHDNIIGYSLALHGKKNRPLAVSHLDESYDLFYGLPSLEEISSFATKIQHEDFFYTPVGPILVAADDDDFSTKEYHGKVIWPKQVAFSVAGLTKQYYRGINENWPWPLLQNIRQAIVKTSEAFFKGISDLGGIPELYYYDEKTNSARYYTDQDDFEGQMSFIQLWSAVGARRIMHDYLSVTDRI